MNGIKDTAFWVSWLKEFYFIFSLNFKDGKFRDVCNFNGLTQQIICQSPRHRQERIGNFNFVSMEEQILIIDQAMNLHH